jgi:hypothetical protein
MHDDDLNAILKAAFPQGYSLLTLEGGVQLRMSRPMSTACGSCKLARTARSTSMLAQLGSHGRSLNTLMSQVKHSARASSTPDLAIRRVAIGWIVEWRRRGPKTSAIEL